MKQDKADLSEWNQLPELDEIPTHTRFTASTQVEGVCPASPIVTIVAMVPGDLG